MNQFTQQTVQSCLDIEGLDMLAIIHFDGQAVIHRQCKEIHRADLRSIREMFAIFAVHPRLKSEPLIWMGKERSMYAVRKDNEMLIGLVASSGFETLRTILNNAKEATPVTEQAA